ncbi:TPA: hypothetical protein EYP37_07260 [Candidatus Poribacteria bacterium]|nr:hypothetical protein [Candidatus Poribacteria bacterium]
MIKGYEDGYYIPDYAWKADGEFQFGDEKNTFSIVTVGKLRYEKTERGWQTGQHNKEETIEARIKKVVSFGKFKIKNGYYTFKPNLLYLDPMGREKFQGRIKIDPKLLLPEVITVTTQDTIIVWEVRFKGYNRRLSIKPPIKMTRSFLIEPASRDLIPKLKERLSRFEINCKFSYNLGRLILTTSDPVSADELKVITSPGIGGIYKGHWENDRFMIDTLLADKSEIARTELSFDPISRPMITVMLKQKVTAEGHIGIYIDDELIGTKYFDNKANLNRIDFLMLSDFRKAQYVAGKLASPDLPKIEIIEVGDQ